MYAFLFVCVCALPLKVCSYRCVYKLTLTYFLTFAGECPQENPEEANAISKPVKPIPKPSRIPVSPNRKFGKPIFPSRVNRELATETPTEQTQNSRRFAGAERWKSLSFRKKKTNAAASKPPTSSTSANSDRQQKHSQSNALTANESSVKPKSRSQKQSDPLSRNSSLRRSFVGLFKSKPRDDSRAASYSVVKNKKTLVDRSADKKRKSLTGGKSKVKTKPRAANAEFN